MSDVNELTKAAYVRYLGSKNRAGDTVTSYCAWIDDLADWNHHDDILQLTKADLEQYFVDLLEAMRDTSAGIAFRSLRAFYNWAVADELVERSPMAKLSEPSTEDRPPDMATDDEIRALLKACAGKSFEDRRDTAMILLLCEPGTPRRAEMVANPGRDGHTGMLLADLDMRGNKVGFMGKGAKWRTIPFGLRTGRALDWYLRVRGKHKLAHLPHLWLGQRGKELTIWGLRQMLARRSRQAEIRLVKPHMLRHTSAHTWKLNGGSEEDMEALFGWTPGSGMARRYGRTARISRAEKAARKMSLADRF
jgi:site-specific recombinase XerD